MSAAVSLPPLASIGRPLDLSPAAFGFLRSSAELADNAEALQARMAEDGYLFLPGCLRRDEVIAARQEVLRRLAESGFLDPDRPVEEGVLRAEAPNLYFRAEVARDNAPLRRVVYAGPMMQIVTRLLGATVRHFDFTWFRVVGKGPGTQPHCDLVYMGRGTQRLYTAWTPMGDIPLEVGGLMLLEGSHRRTDLTGEYLRQDVDTYCENGPGAEGVRTGKIHWEHYLRPGEPWNGAITDNPVALRETFGGRWLTAREYRMGDVLLFSMQMVHGSIDNQTHQVRLSSDTRYQLADEPADERWVGEAPIAHGLAAKRGKIC